MYLSYFDDCLLVACLVLVSVCLFLFWIWFSLGFVGWMLSVIVIFSSHSYLLWNTALLFQPHKYNCLLTTLSLYIQTFG